MTRTKKETLQKTESVDRIRRIKDKKRVVNSKNVVKIHDDTFKRFLEQTITNETSCHTDDLTNNNNSERDNDLSKFNHQQLGKSSNVEDSTNSPYCKMTEFINDEKENSIETSVERELKQSDVDDDELKPVKQPPSEEMQEFELVGLSPENQSPTSESLNAQNKDTIAVKNLEEDLNKEVDEEKPASSTAPPVHCEEKSASSTAPPVHCEDPENLQIQHNEENYENESKQDQRGERTEDSIDQTSDKQSSYIEDDRNVGEDDRNVGEDDRNVGEDDRSVGEDDRSVGEDDRSDGEEGRNVEEDDISVGEDDRSVGEDDRSVGENDSSIMENDNSDREDDRSDLEGDRSDLEDGRNEEGDDRIEGEDGGSGIEDDSYAEKGDEVVDKDEENAEVKSPTYVPRRTGFWDHDNRFADINIQESREPPQSSKLWDKSEVERWQHDKYIESDQGPKEKWEIEQSHGDDNNRRRGNRRNERNFGDFIFNDRKVNQGRRGGSRPNNYNNASQSNSRGGTRRQEYEPSQQNKTETKSQDVRNKRKDQRSQERRYHNDADADQWPALNQRNSSNRERTRNRRQNRKEEEESWGTNAKGSPDWNVRVQNENAYNKNTSHRNTKNRQSNQVNRKKHNDETDGNKSEVREDKNPIERRKSEESGKTRSGRGRGRGREHTNEADIEKTSRELRIDALPPRLRDKAREKMMDDQRDRRSKQQTDQQFDDEQFDDQPDDDIDSTPQQDEGEAPRDKPKRYSSQRQKNAASMHDIPTQISRTEETQQYLEQLAWKQQFVALQSQLQQFNLRSQQQQQQHVANMMQQNINMQLPNMVPPVDQVYNGSLYNMTQEIVDNTSADNVGFINPQINPMFLNQLIAQTQQNTGGLYISSPLQHQHHHPQHQPQQLQQQQQQQQPIHNSETELQQSRMPGSSAIPIKLPPGFKLNQ